MCCRVVPGELPRSCPGTALSCFLWGAEKRQSPSTPSSNRRAAPPALPRSTPPQHSDFLWQSPQQSPQAVLGKSALGGPLAGHPDLKSGRSSQRLLPRGGSQLFGRKKAHKHKLFALVNVQMALGQTAGCPRVNRAKKFVCSPRNTGNINFSLWLTGRVVPGLSRLSKSLCVQSLCAFFLPKAWLLHHSQLGYCITLSHSVGSGFKVAGCCAALLKIGVLHVRSSTDRGSVARCKRHKSAVV